MNKEGNVIYNLIRKNYDYDLDNSEKSRNNLSVKLVIPSYCQANCPFCFNHLTKDTQRHHYGIFFDNLVKSLEMITNNVTDRGITLNITGNETTFNMFLLMKTMNILRKKFSLI